MIYIASPYSDFTLNLRQLRFEMVRKFTADLMQQGLPVYSPIVHGHAIASAHDMPTDWEFWRRHCIHMLARAEKMIVLKLPGWEDSTGVQAEIAYCEQNNIPVEYA